MSDIVREFKVLIDSVDKTNYSLIAPLLAQLKDYFSMVLDKVKKKKDQIRSKIELIPSEEQKIIIDAINLE